VLLVAPAVALAGLAVTPKPQAAADSHLVTAAGHTPTTASSTPVQISTKPVVTDSMNGALAATESERRIVAQRAARSAVRTAPVAQPAWVRPSKGSFTSGYGYRWGRIHAGIDLAAGYGAPIYAAGDGVVEVAGAASGYGNVVKIKHADGIVTVYGHMSSILVAVGQRVSAGDVIAREGSEGRSTGSHLHFGVRTPAGAVDPLPWLRARGVRI